MTLTVPRASMEKKDALDWKLHFLHHRRPFPLRPNAQPFQTPRNYSGMSEPLPQSMPPMTDWPTWRCNNPHRSGSCQRCRSSGVLTTRPLQPSAVSALGLTGWQPALSQLWLALTASAVSAVWLCLSYYHWDLTLTLTDGLEKGNQDSKLNRNNNSQVSCSTETPCDLTCGLTNLTTTNAVSSLHYIILLSQQTCIRTCSAVAALHMAFFCSVLPPPQIYIYIYIYI